MSHAAEGIKILAKQIPLYLIAKTMFPVTDPYCAPESDIEVFCA
jgi:hypothetical protein